MASVIEEEIVCSICLEFLRNPIRMLQCGHNFCQLCLLKIVQSPQSYFQCPNCRTDVRLDNSGVEGISRNRTLENVIEKLKNLGVKDQSDYELLKDASTSFVPSAPPLHSISPPGFPRESSSSEQLPNYFISHPLSSEKRSNPALAPKTQSSGKYALQGRSYYFGRMSRRVAEDTLEKFAKIGEFLLRDSESKDGVYSLSLKTTTKIMHFKLIYDETSRGWGFESTRKWFIELEQLFECYKNHPINGKSIFLSKPFNR
ncbi:uncharacterized protein LOC143465406 [Clavelina lepadiformis]|uniref:uncharacterized protein LOC143465406 n=1 Tax=Clavelina lepadiformis TaxID=159417 RepID=UPI00404191F3